MRTFLVFCIWLTGAALHARVELPVNMVPGARAKITIRCAFSELPPCGYAPVEIEIQNDTGAKQSWEFVFTSPAYGGRNDIVNFTANLAVAKGAARTFRLLVPLAVQPEGHHNSPLRVTTTGPRVAGMSVQQFPTTGRSGKPQTQFIGMGEELGARVWSSLEKECASHGRQLNGARFSITDLPEDWRALAGFSALFVSDSEFGKLTAPQRLAVRDWISQGGSLFLCDGATTPGEFRDGRFGFGSVQAGHAAGPVALQNTIWNLPSSLRGTLADAAGMAAAKKAVGPLHANVPLLIFFIGLFAAVVGPLNLFVFAGANRRHRMFWTTPVISVAASVLLFVLITVQDGFGGSGVRVALVHVLPAEKKAVVQQEQVSRTGVVWSSGFAVREPSLVMPITLATGPNPPRRSLNNDGQKYSGEWFTSRSVQAQWIGSVPPTRGEITLLNAAEVHASGVAPVIVSSFSAPLSRLDFTDEDGRIWTGQNVRAGEKVALRPRSVAPLALPDFAGARLREMWSRVENRQGFFYATSDDPAALAETLPSIRWQQQRVYFVGPITAAP